MSKAIVNALALHLLQTSLTTSYEVAVSVATTFVEDNAELFAGPAPMSKQQYVGGLEPVSPPAPLDMAATAGERAVVHRVPVVGADGLTDKQRAAVGTVGLCPNCQQPRNSHLPGCARASGEAPKAVTKTPLPPVS